MVRQDDGMKERLRACFVKKRCCVLMRLPFNVKMKVESFQ